MKKKVSFSLKSRNINHGPEGCVDCYGQEKPCSGCLAVTGFLVAINCLNETRDRLVNDFGVPFPEANMMLHDAFMGLMVVANKTVPRVAGGINQLGIKMEPMVVKKTL